MDIKIDATKLESAIKNTISAVQKSSKEQQTIFEQEVDRVLANAVKKTPIRQGILRSEGRQQVEILGDKMKGTIEFGGLASSYAEIQHENEDYEHPKGGQDHFLYGKEYSAWNDIEQEQMLKRMSEQVKKDVEKEMK